MSNIAIRVDNLSKLYRIGAAKQRHATRYAGAWVLATHFTDFTDEQKEKSVQSVKSVAKENIRVDS